MRIDLNSYHLIRPFIKNWYKNNVNKDVSNAVSMIAASPPYYPCIAVAFILAEELGYTAELREIIERLIKFYRYTEIIGQSKDSPYIEKYDIVPKRTES